MRAKDLMAGGGVLVTATLLVCSVARPDAPEPLGQAQQAQDATSNVVTIDGCTVDLDALPRLALRDTCVYRRDHGQIAAGKDPVDLAYRYAPAFALWSDGADKRRWAIFTTAGQAVSLAEAQAIDASNGDDWILPAGTILVKEFSRDGVLLETRLVVKKPDGTFFLGSYRWNQPTPEAPSQTDGTFVNPDRGEDFSAGAAGAQRPWHIPAAGECDACHNLEGQTSRYLGFTAVQLFNAGSSLAGFTQTTLELRRSLRAKLVSPPPQLDESVLLDVPGDAVTKAALGYLHGNCGHCHNGLSHVETGILLRMKVAELSPGAEASRLGAYTTNVNAAYKGPKCNPRFYAPAGPNAPFAPERRITGGDAEHSAIWCRMASRGRGSRQMPPVGSLLPDTEGGLATVAAWIDSLPAP